MVTTTSAIGAPGATTGSAAPDDLWRWFTGYSQEFAGRCGSLRLLFSGDVPRGLVISGKTRRGRGLTGSRCLFDGEDFASALVHQLQGAAAAGQHGPGRVVGRHAVAPGADHHGPAPGQGVMARISSGVWATATRWANRWWPTGGCR